MKKKQIFKEKSSFEKVSSKLIVIFGFIVAFLTIIWLLVQIFASFSDKVIYFSRHIQTTTLPFAVAISGLLIARSCINLKNKKVCASTITNMVLAIVILIMSVVFMTLSLFWPGGRDFTQLVEKIIKYPVISLVCIIWVLSFNLMEIKNADCQNIATAKKNNAILILTLCCLSVPMYVLLFCRPLILPKHPFEQGVKFCRKFIDTMFVLMALVMSLQLLLICLTQKQKKGLVLLSVSIGLVIVFYALAKSWERISSTQNDWLYLYIASALAIIGVSIPIFIKTRK